jgi:hypothetical protein
MQLLSSLEIHYKSKSGSNYSFTEEGVYRIATHWGRAANCRWRLLSNSEHPNQQLRIGYAKWIDFFPNLPNENWYFVSVNFETKEVYFQHKNHKSYQKELVLRNAAATSKTIQEVKQILLTNEWAKYSDFEDLEKARITIITELITTKKSWLQMKLNWNKESYQVSQHY